MSIKGAVLLTTVLGLSLLPALARADEDATQPGKACPMPPAEPAQTAGPPLPAAFEAANAAREAVDAGRLEEVEGRLASALAAAEDLDDGRARARLLIHAGRSYELLAERRPAARSALTLRAVEVLGRASEAANAAGDRRLYSYAVGYLGAVYEREGRYDDARELTRRALFAAQQTDAPDALYRWQWQLGRIHRAAGKLELALEDYRQAVATLKEIRDQLVPGAAGAEAAFREAVEPIYVDLVDLLLARSARTDSKSEKRALLAEARNMLEAWKAAELRDYFRDACLDAQRKATPDEVPGAVVVYPILLPDRTELVVSAGGELESYVSPVERDRLIAEVREFRRKLEKRTTRQYLRHAYVLYDWLIRPLEPALSGREVRALVFVPGGALRTVPMAALRDRESGEFLIEKYPLAIAPGLTLTEPRPIDRERVQLLAAGITEPVQGFPGLENVGREIEAVGAVFPGQKLVDADFVADRLELEIAERPFGIVHIASHGEFSADISRSYLLAYDEKVSMDQLAGMVATTRFREQQPLELLALSACRTAAGDDRAALGLAGVALRAGARSAIATLWSVNDQATTDLVSEFYAQLAEPGLSRAQALQRAQVKMLGMHHYRHPGYWSAFLLISSWL
jgi:CHAT domain-containing protein